MAHDVNQDQSDAIPEEFLRTKSVDDIVITARYPDLAAQQPKIKMSSVKSGVELFSWFGCWSWDKNIDEFF